MESIMPIFANALSEFMCHNMMPFVVAFAFMFIDVLSGICCGVATHTFSSTKLKQGLWHKLGYILVMCVVAILQIAMFDPNFKVDFDFPLFDVVCYAIVFIELCSIIENATVLNPDLNKFIGKYFDINKDSDDDNLPFFDTVDDEVISLRMG